METTPQLPARIRRLAALARLRLFWETYAPALALPALASALFLVVTWLGAWEVLGDPVRLAALGTVLFLLVRGVWRARALRVPTESDALRRLEDTAGLAHRPLDTLRDHAVLAPELWPAHARRAEVQADAIRRVGREPALGPVDRYGLRVVVPIALGLALFLSLGWSGERLRRALVPDWRPFTNPQAVTFEAWIDPPDYTGRPPIYAQGEGPLNAPAGSTVVVRASGARDLPRPRFDLEDARARFLPLRRLGERSLEARATVEASATLDWRVGWRRKAWRIEVQPDQPPVIEITEPPEADKQDRLVVMFDASDDYGVESVELEMVELTEGLTAEAARQGDTVVARTDAGAFKSAEGRTLKLDLTRNPLAGRKVVGWLVAVDGAGQRARSAPHYFTVPDKIFVEPLAKAIIEQRGLIVAGLDAGGYAPPPPGEPDDDFSDGTFDTEQRAFRLGRAPAPIQRSARLIDAVTMFPDPGVFGDPVVYVGLRHVGRSLRYARGADALSGLPEHMWKLALRAEFGVLGTALQEMQEAEAALREGIARGASQREIDTLFERYNQAVENWMEELRRNATEADEDGGGGGGPMGSTDEIAELLKAIEEANARGDTEGARQALAQLAELLENMQIQLSRNASGEGEGEPSDSMSEEMRENLDDLAERLADQRELEDETRQREREQLAQELGQRPEPGQPGEGQQQQDGPGGQGGEESTRSPEQLAERQQEIESLIDGLRERLSEEGERSAGTRPGEGGEDAQGPGDGGPDGAPQDRAGGDGQGEPQQGRGGGREGQPEDGRGGGGSGERFAENAVQGTDDALERAAEAMRRSREALENGDLAGSREAQREAIEALRDAGDQLSRQVANTAGQQGMEGEGDPLGRGIDGFESDASEADLSEQDAATRSREIQDELRRRASEAEREQQERDYLDRLLNRF